MQIRTLLSLWRSSRGLWASGGCWAACALLLILASPASPVQAQEQPCLPNAPEFVRQQLTDRNYALVCLPADYFLFDAQADTWIHSPDPLELGHQVQLALFQSQVMSGQFDAYMVGGQPGWQTTGPLQWVRDFAVMGSRLGSQDGFASGGRLFVLGMWVPMPLDLNAYSAALQARAARYERIELHNLHLPYLDGEGEPPPQTAYILDGAQMQELFRLDSVFINNRYVVVDPDPTAPTPAGMPVLSFFSGTPISSAEMAPLLDGLVFRREPLPTEPALEQVTMFRTPTGLLTLVPEIDAAARSFIEGKAREIGAAALDFAREFPITHLLPFQLITADANLYWAPGDWQTGRLLLWEYTGGAHGNLNVGAWTFDAAGSRLDWEDVLVWEEAEALEAIVAAAIEHRRMRERPDRGRTEAQIEEAVRRGLPDLAAVSAWNPVIRNGATGLWITLLPYTIAAYVDGVQEFFVPMPLAAEG